MPRPNDEQVGEELQLSAEHKTLNYAIYVDPIASAFFREQILDFSFDESEDQDLKASFDEALLRSRSKMIWVFVAMRRAGRAFRSICFVLNKQAPDPEESIVDTICRCLDALVDGYIDHLISQLDPLLQLVGERDSLLYSNSYGSAELSPKSVDVKKTGSVYCKIDSFYQHVGLRASDSRYEFSASVNAIAQCVQNGIRTYNDVDSKTVHAWLAAALERVRLGYGWKVLENEDPSKFDNQAEIVVKDRERPKEDREEAPLSYEVTKKFKAATLVEELDALDELNSRPAAERKAIIGSLVAALDRISVGLTDNEQKTLGSAALRVASRIEPVHLAETDARTLNAVKAATEDAIPHRARTDLFGVKLGKEVTVQRVNQFLQDNPGKKLAVHEKIQLAKVIQELMKLEKAELWETIDGYQYNRRISTEKYKKTRRFVLESVGRRSKDDNETTDKTSVVDVPSNIEFLHPKIK